MALLTAACVAWQIYEMATAVEAPSTALRVLQISLLGLAGFACVGSTVMYVRSAGG